MPLESVTGSSASPKGLKNIGNTCYMNASLQCLLQTPGLSHLLLSSLDGSGSPAQTRLLSAYRSLVLKQRAQQTQVTVELKQLKKAIKEQYRQYGGYRQMDPTEFFLHLIGCFEDMSQDLKCRLKEIFGVETETCQKCESCGKIDTFTSTMMSLCLPLKPADIELTYRNGETSTSFTLICPETSTAEDLSNLIQARHSLTNPSLTLQTLTAIDHILNPQETIRRMSLQHRQICYYENCEDCYLLEVKIYHKVVMTKQFLRLVTKRIQKELDGRAVLAAVRSVTAVYFAGVPGKVIFRYNGRNAFQTNLLEDSTASLRDLDTLLAAFHGSVLSVAVYLKNYLNFPKQAPRPSLHRIGKSISLDDCLTEFSAVDNMGVENMLKCSECGVPTVRSRWSKLTQVSQYIVICLQRYCELDGSKDMRTVHFSQEIDLQRCSKFPDSRRFSLYAVIKHRGNFHNGHYTSCVKGPTGWHLCNDSTIKPIPASVLQATLEEDAYVLFYQSLNDI